LALRHIAQIGPDFVLKTGEFMSLKPQTPVALRLLSVEQMNELGDADELLAEDNTRLTEEDLGYRTAPSFFEV
jgi:hypothetical protein